jgi:hypothetical protein
VITQAPIVLYVILFLATLFAPLRWSIVAFLLLANIDLGSLSSSIGVLNTAKAMILPVLMLWRFNAYAGHRKLSAAPFIWCLLVLYVAIASAWSIYPAYAVKLLGHMVGSLVICMMLTRATKAGYLSFQTILPTTCGVLLMAAFHWRFLHDWGGETERFSTFSGAQAFAAFLVALYCGALFAKPIHLAVRIPLCVVLVAGVLANGSRIWIIGLIISTLLAIFLSESKQWIKIVTFGISLIGLSVVTVEFDTLMDFVAQHASSNRIANAITNAYVGNFSARGLGTYNLRHALVDRTIAGIEQGSTMQMVFGHGTCNGAVIAATISKNPDPNRALHDEWLRALYEWGLVGLTLWLVFIGSLVTYAARGAMSARGSYAKPLLAYLPAFALGLTGENIIAGAGNAVSVGLLVLIALATMAHRTPLQFRRKTRSPLDRSLAGVPLDRMRAGLAQ